MTVRRNSRMTRTPEMGELIHLFNERLDNPEFDFLLKEYNPYKDEKGQTTSKDKAVVYSLTGRAKNLVKDPDTKVPQRGTVKNGKVSSKFGMNTGSPDKQCGRLTIQGDKKPKTRSCKDYTKNYGSVKEEDVLLASPETPLQDVSNKKASIDTPLKKKARKKGIRVRINEKNKDKKEKKEREHRRKERIFPGSDQLRRLSKGIMEDVVESENIEITLQEMEAAIRKLLQNATEEERKIFLDVMEGLGFYSTERINKVCTRAGYRNTEEWLKFQNALSNAQKGSLYKKED